jgi:hypothetical protein
MAPALGAPIFTWLMAAFLDISFFIIQALIGAFKLLIAFFLLWLITDLFLLKLLALVETAAPIRR